MNCPVCEEEYDANYPEVKLSLCQCVMCVYCTIASIMTHRCVSCHLNNCHYFEYVNVELTNEQLFAVVARFNNDYQIHIQGIPNAQPLRTEENLQN